MVLRLFIGNRRSKGMDHVEAGVKQGDPFGPEICGVLADLPKRNQAGMGRWQKEARHSYCHSYMQSGGNSLSTLSSDIDT